MASARLKLLLVGSGGREHALADKLHRDAPDAELFIAPGNPGTASIGRNVPIAAGDLEALAAFAADEAIGLTVVGPEQPLAAGIAERFAARGLPLFGPSAAAARIESSKAFAKALMAEHGVPTAAHATFTDAERARAHVRAADPPLVVKASGLAAGKGVMVCATHEEALGAVTALMEEGRHGDAGREVVIEEFLEGEELSVFFLTDGTRAVPLIPSRDHKRRFEGDRGPNTGGMGAFAPVPELGAGLVERVRREIADPVLAALAGSGSPYRGFLYAGLMLTAGGPRVIEFNCRLGDPEAQVVLPLTGTDLVEPMHAVARGEALGDWSAGLRQSLAPAPAPAAAGAVGEPARAPGEPAAALVTVLVSDGYPGPHEKGRPIRLGPGLEDRDVRVYHAGTRVDGGRLVTAGGRVLGVTGLGATLEEAAAASRRGVAAVDFEGMDWRRDIGAVEAGAGSSTARSS